MPNSGVFWDKVLSALRLSLSKRLGIAPAVIQVTDRISELEVDSLTVSAVILEMEEETGLQLSDDTLMAILSCETIGDIVEVVVHQGHVCQSVATNIGDVARL